MAKADRVHSTPPLNSSPIQAGDPPRAESVDSFSHQPATRQPDRENRISESRKGPKGYFGGSLKPSTKEETELARRMLAEGKPDSEFPRARPLESEGAVASLPPRIPGPGIRLARPAEGEARRRAGASLGGSQPAPQYAAVAIGMDLRRSGAGLQRA